MEVGLAYYEVWEGDLFLFFTYSSTEAARFAEAGCTVILEGSSSDMEDGLACYEVWEGDLLLFFTYSSAEAARYAEAGCTVILEGSK